MFRNFILFAFVLVASIFLGGKTSYANINRQNQLLTLQAEEAQLTSENQSLKKQIEIAEEQLKKAKKRVRGGAIIAGLTGAAGAGGLIYSKGQKNKKKIIDAKITALEEEKKLLLKAQTSIITLRRELCSSDQDACTLVRVRYADEAKIYAETDLQKLLRSI